MTIFEQAQQSVLQALRKTNNLAILSEKEKEIFDYPSSEMCILLEVEYLDSKEMVQSVDMHLRLSSHFPLELPKIFLPKEHRHKFELLPHVEESGNICLYDTETISFDFNNPVGLAKECIRKARRILEEGLAKTNFLDYEDEFQSYWIRSYGEKDCVDLGLLNITGESLDSEKIKLLKLDPATHIYNYIVHQDEPHAHNFIEFLTSKKIKIVNQDVCYLGQIKLEIVPPFSMTNKAIAKLVRSLDVKTQKSFKRYINRKSVEKMVLATINIKGKLSLIGWMHKPLRVSKRRPGFRKGILDNNQLLSTFQAGDYVSRFFPTIFSPTQQTFRTTGIVGTEQRHFNFLVAGIGSIGSNLVTILNSYFLPEFRLVDFDILILQNIGRHFLGYNYVGSGKAPAMRHYLLNKNPFQKIRFKRESIVTVFEKEPEFLLEADYIFLATGKTNIEAYFARLQNEGKINTPIFLVWVEPYLAGGHCLFLYPGSIPYDAFVNENGFFKYNVIEESEYLSGNKMLSLREAGCQTGFTPYSQGAITMFLSMLFPKLRNIIIGNKSCSTAFTWVGDLQFLVDNNIAVSEFYKLKLDGQIIEHSV